MPFGSTRHTIAESGPYAFYIALIESVIESRGIHALGRQTKIGAGWIFRVSTTEASMKNLISRFVRDESGATAIEYGLIAAGIAVVIITAVQLVGSNLTATFNSVADAVKAP